MNFCTKIYLNILLSLFLGILFCTVFKYSLAKESKVLKIEIDSDVLVGNNFVKVYYDKGNSFNEEDIALASSRTFSNDKNKQVLLFKLGSDKKILKKLRLDFENFNEKEEIKILSLSLLNNDNSEVFLLSNDDVYRKISGIPNGLSISKNKLTVLGSDNLDPFIVYNILDCTNFYFYLTLILVFSINVFFFRSILNWFKLNLKDGYYGQLIVTLFFGVLFLKIAWVTFILLILTLYSVISFLLDKQKRIILKLWYLIYILIFIIYLFFGKVSKFEDLSIPIIFVLVSIVFLFRTFHIDIDKLQKDVVVIYTVLMSVIIITGILFLLNYGEFYDIDYLNYFVDDNIKLFNQKVFFWIKYSHSLFISSFFFCGFFFCVKQYQNKQIGKSLYLSYFIFTLISILLLGSRMMFFIFVLFCFVFFVVKSFKIRSFSLVVLWMITLSFLFFNICKIDQNRCRLWKMSYNAIEENTSGFGINSNVNVLKERKHLLGSMFTELPKENHSHNQFLTDIIELGIIGFILKFLLWTVLGYYLFRFSEETYFYIYIMFLYIMIIESPFQTATPSNFYVFIFYLSLIREKKVINNQLI
ncbi:O-antigen ligase family protein [Thalassobellus suaedae]|uniref:O-antigen ligase-related domain-containing protein n=1 Tax=Thalassobellus suaedae TaxID=3074124 RepID=A0ABY9Y7Z1_9FLAO|nr:hypothetical protein RHP49_06860 [Flavobacteriaceae bacterium HL-DH10]